MTIDYKKKRGGKPVSQKQSHRARRAWEEWNRMVRDQLRRLEYLESRPPVYRPIRYIRWIMLGRRLWVK